MSKFSDNVDRGLASVFQSRRIPFTSFVLSDNTAVVTIMLSSPAGSLSVPFSISKEGDKIYAASTGKSIEVNDVNGGINFIMLNVRKLETRIGKFNL